MGANRQPDFLFFLFYLSSIGPDDGRLSLFKYLKSEKKKRVLPPVRERGASYLVVPRRSNRVECLLCAVLCDILVHQPDWPHHTHQLD